MARYGGVKKEVTFMTLAERGQAQGKTQIHETRQTIRGGRVVVRQFDSRGELQKRFVEGPIFPTSGKFAQPFQDR